MDVVILPQLKNLGASAFGAPVRYRIAEKEPSAAVQLDDRAVNRIELATSDAVQCVFPLRQPGYVRDFFARIVITAAEPPEVSFVAPDGEVLSFEGADEDALKCDSGVNVFAFTETDAGVFIVNRKQVDIELEVAFDACGGTGIVSPKTYKLGAKYGTLQTPVRGGYEFSGWFTKAEGGTQVTANDTVKSGVDKLYAQWALYVDLYVDAICPAKNLTFYSSGGKQWTVDAATAHSAPGSARSGAIADSQESVLETTVTGPGTLTFWWKVSSEQGYDKLHVILDGSQLQEISGEYGWVQKTINVTGTGLHTVQWKYDKDVSVANGSDCGWIDDVVWTPSGT